jgi:hypothetical protein
MVCECSDSYRMSLHHCLQATCRVVCHQFTELYVAMNANVNQKKEPLNRQVWLDAAVEMLVELGIGSVSISRLAEKLNITRGSFYHHFSGRNDRWKAWPHPGGYHQLVWRWSGGVFKI